MDREPEFDTVRARRIAALKDQQGYLELMEDLQAAEQRAWARMQTEWRMGAPVDQRKVDELRGVSETIKKLRKGPERAAAQIERAEQAEAVKEADTE